MTSQVLIVDDEKDMTRFLKKNLELDMDCSVTMAFSARMAIEILEKSEFDLMLCDIRMPGMDGFELLEYTREHYPELTVLMLTAYSSIDVAVEAIRKGAYDFIPKPFEQDEIVFKVQKALERSSLLKENTRLKQEKNGFFGKLAGESTAMRKVFEQITMVAQSDVTVLITGESGTGKDLTAQSIHSLSDRKNRPFVPVNCPTIPEHILESELFGYKKGAFTNAQRDKKGLFQEADMGTLFLDEIGDIPPMIQTKLLRVLQEKQIKPLGDTKAVDIDVRIIASTNRDLDRKIKNEEFREDLFYRLNVLTIHLPPLRERPTDIPLLARHLVAAHSEKLGKPEKMISDKLMDVLVKHSWPGNVRELENILIQGIVYADSDTITCSDVPVDELDTGKAIRADSDFSRLNTLPYREAKEELLRQFNHQYIGAMLAITNGNITQAAKKCGLERQALQQVIKRFDIDPEQYR